MQPSSSYRQPQQTILVSNNQNPISSDHPLFYVKQKNYFLQQLSSKFALQSKFNQIDIKRNVRVDHLIEKHAKIKEHIKKQQRKKKMFLNSDQFVPILGLSQDDKKKKRQLKETQKLRQQLYNNYVEDFTIHEAPQKDTYSLSDFEEFQLVKKNEELKNFTVLSDYRSDPARRKQLYLIDMEIAKLKQEQTLDKMVKKKQAQCSNHQLLSRISNTILSSYMVYFDEIFNAMIDEMLEQEVIYLNNLQAEFYLNPNQEGYSKNQPSKKNIQNREQRHNYSRPSNLYKDTKQLAADVKALKMMELVRCLDQLACD